MSVNYIQERQTEVTNLSQLSVSQFKAIVESHLERITTLQEQIAAEEALLFAWFKKGKEQGLTEELLYEF